VEEISGVGPAKKKMAATRPDGMYLDRTFGVVAVGLGAFMTVCRLLLILMIWKKKRSSLSRSRFLFIIVHWFMEEISRLFTIRLLAPPTIVSLSLFVIHL